MQADRDHRRVTRSHCGKVQDQRRQQKNPAATIAVVSACVGGCAAGGTKFIHEENEKIGCNSDGHLFHAHLPVYPFFDRMLPRFDQDSFGVFAGYGVAKMPCRAKHRWLVK